MGLTAVEVRGVTRHYGATMALRGVTARFEPGQITVIEGHNGSGKSTLLGILSTAIRPSAGSVSWAPFGDDAQQAREHIGWLGHDALVYPDLPGLQNLAWAAQIYGLGPEALSRITERMGLGAFAKRPVRTMSRGQRQRIALARALLHRPSLLLLDEPTTGLDKDGIELLMRVTREEAEGGAIVVLIAHDASLVERLGARSLKMASGRVVTP